MFQLAITTLHLAASGFGEWEWTGTGHLPGGPCIEETEDDCFYAYESALEDSQVDFARTDELEGHIRDERGRVYKIGDSYEMVWAEVA